MDLGISVIPAREPEMGIGHYRREDLFEQVSKGAQQFDQLLAREDLSQMGIVGLDH